MVNIRELFLYDNEKVEWKQVIRITGVVFFFLAVIAYLGSPIASFFFLLIALLWTPMANNWLKQKHNLELGVAPKLVLMVILFAVAGYFFPKNIESPLNPTDSNPLVANTGSENQTSETLEDKEIFVADVNSLLLTREEIPTQFINRGGVQLVHTDRSTSQKLQSFRSQLAILDESNPDQLRMKKDLEDSIGKLPPAGDGFIDGILQTISTPPLLIDGGVQIEFEFYRFDSEQKTKAFFEGSVEARKNMGGYTEEEINPAYKEDCFALYVSGMPFDYVTAECVKGNVVYYIKKKALNRGLGVEEFYSYKLSIDGKIREAGR